MLELLVGALIGGVISWYFAQSSRKDLESARDSLATGIEALGVELGAHRELLAEALRALRPADPPAATRLEQEASSSIARANDAVSQLPPNIAKSVTEKLSGPGCPKCGKPMHASGMRADQGGVLVWWHTCPEHGAFPSAHIDDIADY